MANQLIYRFFKDTKGRDMVHITSPFSDLNLMRFEAKGDRENATKLSAEVAGPVEVEHQEEKLEIDTFTKAQLVEYARDNDIKIDPQSKKADILQAIKHTVS